MTKRAGESRIQSIVRMIDQSEILKAGVQGKAECLADSIVPFSFATSLATLLLTRNLTKAMSVLMVDYSCALKLSVPIAVISAMREAAGRRILVKGGKFLEGFAQADTIIFDKSRQYKLVDPMLWTSLPLLYMIFALLNGFVLKMDVPNAKDSPFPYFFLNATKHGWGFVFKWAATIFVAYMVSGYLFYLVKSIKKSKK